MNLGWTITIGTLIALSLALGFVLVLFYYERKRRTLERESEQKYSELFNGVTDLIYIHSAEGIIRQVNKSVTTLLGLPQEKIAGHSILEFLPASYARHFENYLRQIHELPSSGELTGSFSLVAPHSKEGASRDNPIILEYRSRIIRNDAGEIVAIWGIVRDQTERFRQEKVLRKKSRQLQALFLESEKMRTELSVLSQKMLRLQEEDRLRISRELHDEVGQTLTAISTTLEIARQDVLAGRSNVGEQIADVQSLTREIMRSVRRVVRELRPVVIDELGLLESLRKYTSDFESRFGIHTVFSYDPIEEQLSSDEKVTIYRIVQESLTNVARHSGATEAQVSLFERQLGGANGDDPISMTMLEIVDNGRGMKAPLISPPGVSLPPSFADSVTKGTGLLGIKERVRLLSGTFQITSDAGHGTRLSVKLPKRSS